MDQFLSLIPTIQPSISSGFGIHSATDDPANSTLDIEELSSAKNHPIALQDANESSFPSWCLGTPNTHSNGTFTTNGYSLSAVIALSILVGIFCLYALLGNIMVIVIICVDRVVSSQAHNLYLISLAVADSLLALLIIPFSLANELLGTWPFGPVYCKFYLAADVLLCTASIWNICAIGLDRYWSVQTPIRNRRKRTKKVIRHVILLVWSLSFLISVPPFIFGFKTIPITDNNSCFLNDESWYILFSCTLSFFLPAIIIAPVYTKIYKIGMKYSRPCKSRLSSLQDEKGQDTNKTAKESEIVRQAYLPNGQHDENYKEENNTGNDEKQVKHNIVCKIINASECDEVEDEFENDEFEEKFYNCQLLYPNEEEKNITLEKNDPVAQECSVTMLRSPTSDNSTLTSKKSELTSRVRIYSNTSMQSGVMSLIFQSRRRVPEQDGESLSSKRNSIFQKRERRFTLIICLVTGGFLTCWYPFFQTYVVYALCGTSCCINKTMFKLFFWLGYLNSGLNPAIYTIFNKEFRRAFGRIFLEYRRNKY